MEFHLNQLARHCRIRLCKAKSRAPMHYCHSYSKELQTSFGVDTLANDESIFPTKFCNPCFAALNRDQKARKEGMPHSQSITPFVWKSHSSDCSVRNM